MKFLTLTFALLISFSTVVKADDVVGKIFEDRKSGVQLQLKCLNFDKNHQCLKKQYALVAGGQDRMIGPVLGEEIFEFFSDDIREHLDMAKLKDIEDKEYLEIPDFFPNGVLPATEWWYREQEGAGNSAGIALLVGFFGFFPLAICAAGPVGWGIYGGVLVMFFATPTVIDLVVLSAKGVALGATSVALGSVNLGVAIGNKIKKLKRDKVFFKLGKAMNGNPEVDRISHRKFARLVESIEALSF